MKALTQILLVFVGGLGFLFSLLTAGIGFIDMANYTGPGMPTTSIIVMAAGIFTAAVIFVVAIIATLLYD